MDQISRRSFLKGAGMTALAVKVSNCKYYVTVNVAVDKSGL